MKVLIVTLLLGAAGKLVADDRIIGGYECIPHSLPWQVSLYSNTGGHVCGGSLLSANWVISAAHCSLPSLQIRIGKHNIETVEEGEQNIRAAKQIIHPNYDKWGLENDLMMIKLASPAVLSESAQPIALPSTCVSVGTECLVSGWGTTISPGESYPPLLQCLNITILEDSNCDAAYPGEYTDNMLCAGFLEAGKDSCKGDSGGPLVCSGMLQGLVSWGHYICATQNKPGVYVKLCNYLNWINNTMKS